MCVDLKWVFIWVLPNRVNEGKKWGHFWEKGKIKGMNLSEEGNKGEKETKMGRIIQHVISVAQI